MLFLTFKPTQLACPTRAFLKRKRRKQEMEPPDKIVKRAGPDGNIPFGQPAKRPLPQ